MVLDGVVGVDGYCVVAGDGGGGLVVAMVVAVLLADPRLFLSWLLNPHTLGNCQAMFHFPSPLRNTCRYLFYLTLIAATYVSLTYEDCRGGGDLPGWGWGLPGGDGGESGGYHC